MVIFLGVFSSVYAQELLIGSVPNLKITFAPIIVGKFNQETDEMVDSWKSLNTGVYKVNSSNQTISYIEYKGDGREVVKMWKHKIMRCLENDLLYVFGIMTDRGVVNIVIWKDESMLAIQDIKWDYLIAEKF